MPATPGIDLHHDIGKPRRDSIQAAYVDRGLIGPVRYDDYGNPL